MKLRVAFVVLVAFAAVGACSLNPQPLPPGSYDAGSDVSMVFNDAAAGEDAGAPPLEDAGSDAATQLADDAGDAATDAEVDAAADAPQDAPDGD